VFLSDQPSFLHITALPKNICPSPYVKCHHKLTYSSSQIAQLGAGGGHILDNIMEQLFEVGDRKVFMGTK